jgi:hypothetical protein
MEQVSAAGLAELACCPGSNMDFATPAYDLVEQPTTGVSERPCCSVVLSPQ